jgi:hypothetical protein
MCGQILNVLAPLPEAIRFDSIGALSAAALSNAQLTSARQDTDGATAGESVMAWADACLARETMGHGG